MARNLGTPQDVEPEWSDDNALRAEDRRAAEGLPSQRSPRTTSGEDERHAAGRPQRSESEEESEAGVRGTERSRRQTSRTDERISRSREGVE